MTPASISERVYAPFAELGIEVVDAHANVGRFEDVALPGNEGSSARDHAQALLAAMSSAHVRSAIVCSLDALCRREPDSNDALAELQRRHPSALHGLATVHPGEPGAAERLDLAFGEHELVGLKLNPRLQSFDPVSREVDGLLEVCRARDRAVMIHCGTTRRATHPATLARLARRHPDVRFVFAHMGGTNTHVAVDEVATLGNVYLETSVCRHVYDPIRRAVARVGASRVMFGSDFPFGSVPIELYRVFASELTPDELGYVLGETARAVFRLPQGSSRLPQGSSLP